MRIITLSLFLLMTALTASAQNPTVRILFFTGDVTIGSEKPKIGRMLETKDRITVGKGATLQLSVNGKVIKYTKPVKLRVSDVVKRADKGENLAVSNTLRTLAGASGADRAGRSSVAGATRLEDSSKITGTADAELASGFDNLNQELGARIGIEDPFGKTRELLHILKGDEVVILEPRSSAVPQGALRFRWLGRPQISRYVITVRDYLDNELFRIETADTTVVWENPSLSKDILYFWKLADADNALNSSSTSFRILGDSEQAKLDREIAEVTNELGEDNPALPMVLGALYAEYDCHGHTARNYTACATASKEHYDSFMEMACMEYIYEMYMPTEEVVAIWEPKE